MANGIWLLVVGRIDAASDSGYRFGGGHRNAAYGELEIVSYPDLIHGKV